MARKLLTLLVGLGLFAAAACSGSKHSPGLPSPSAHTPSTTPASATTQTEFSAGKPTDVSAGTASTATVAGMLLDASDLGAGWKDNTSHFDASAFTTPGAPPCLAKANGTSAAIGTGEAAVIRGSGRTENLLDESVANFGTPKAASADFDAKVALLSTCGSKPFDAGSGYSATAKFAAIAFPTLAQGTHAYRMTTHFSTGADGPADDVEELVVVKTSTVTAMLLFSPAAQSSILAPYVRVALTKIGSV